METRDLKPNSQRRISQDDGGLWLKMDSRPVTDCTEAESGNPDEMPPNEIKVGHRVHAVLTRHYSMMEDDYVDDTFTPPPLNPPSTFVDILLPAEGSTGTMVNNSFVTCSNGATEATVAEANPSSLDWHPGEKELAAAHSKMDEVIASTAQSSEGSVDHISTSNYKDPTSPTDHHHTSMEGTDCLMDICHDTSRRTDQDNIIKDKESNEETEDNVIWRETDIEKDNYPKETSSNIDVISNKEGDRTNSDSKLVSEYADCYSVGTNVPTLSDLSTQDDGLQTCGLLMVCKCNQNKMDSATNQSQVQETMAEVTNDDQEQQITRSHSSTENDWLRTDSDTSEMQVPQLPITESGEVTMTEEEQGDGGVRIAIDLQQGEELLQRLQLVQQRHDDVSENPSTSQQVAQEMRSEEKGTLKTEVADLTEDQRIVRAEGDDSNDSQHYFSEVEMSIERQKQEEVGVKQNLQRAEGILNLADDPDVLEIPFRTNILLEPHSPQVKQDQRSDWQFSEQKMRKEISQEIQRELVMVNQGKIPGGYSKGEVRQLKETKLLFEGFQQDNTEGPARQRKHPITLMRGHIYPSVLERTQSLEMFSLKSCPVSRTHSLRLHESASSEWEKSPENPRSKSPTGVSRDKTRLSPYPRQDKHLHRSMDSITSDVSTSAVEMGSKIREDNSRQESPVLRQNPFFKLRPALALQPEVEKDIREAKEREEELRRQRCTLYGENSQNSQDEGMSRLTKTLSPDVRKQSRGKLERVWPPSSDKDQLKSEQTQQEPKVQRAGGQRAPLWQQWESGLINGQPSKEKN